MDVASIDLKEGILTKARILQVIRVPDSRLKSPQRVETRPNRAPVSSEPPALQQRRTH